MPPRQGVRGGPVRVACGRADVEGGGRRSGGRSRDDLALIREVVSYWGDAMHGVTGCPDAPYGPLVNGGGDSRTHGVI